MSTTQAEEFATRYPTVITQFNDTPAEGGMDTGFSATVFSDSAGNLTLAFRGTEEPIGDIVPTDKHIAFYGGGYDQIVAMYNWWNRVSTPAGQTVRQFAIEPYFIHSSAPEGAVLLYWESGQVYYLEEADSVTSTGELNAALSTDGDHLLSLAGHSLGGHLAMAFGSLFSEAVSDVTVFNAPGFVSSPSNTAFFSKLGGTVPAGTATTNVIADEAHVGDAPWSAIAGLHSRPGTAADIAIENQWLSDEPDPTGARNHSQQTITDALAVYSVLYKLDPTLAPAEFKKILAGAAHGTAGGLEGIIDVLEGIFGKNTTALNAGNSHREALYQAIYGLSDVTGLYQVKATGDLPAGGLADLAKTDIAYRYALVNLNPFAITGNAALYDPHNTNGELNRYDAAADSGLTDSYLNDRADFLALKLQLAIEDKPGTSAPVGLGAYYRDFASGLEIDAFNTFLESRGTVRNYQFGSDAGETITGGGHDDHLYGGDGNDTMSGGFSNDYLEGNAGNDNLDGGVGRDTLLGGLGNDTLDGGNDTVTDRLEGGKGTDTYIARDGDVIYDSDGLGSIEFEGVTLTGGTRQYSSGHYESADGKFKYTLADGTLFVQSVSTGAYFSIVDYAADSLGLLLGQREADPLPSNLVGRSGTDGNDLFDWRHVDLPPVQFPDNWSGFGSIATQGGDDYVDLVGFVDPALGIPGPENSVGGFKVYADNDLIGRGSIGLSLGGYAAPAPLSYQGQDRVYGSIYSDHIEGAAGEDMLSGEDGDDILYGGAGHDLIFGGGGKDVIFGGYLDLYGEQTAPDTVEWHADIWGDLEGDSIYGGGGNDLIRAGDGQDFIDGGGGDDLISATAGDDLVTGGAGLDTLYGGYGSDRLYGGDGNDFFGDGNNNYWLCVVMYDSQMLNAVLYYTVDPTTIVPPPEGTLYSMQLDPGAFTVGEAGNDILYGGAGDDVLFGQSKDDVLFGDAGIDELQGNGGSDTLYGGAGDDKLLGNGPAANQSEPDGDDYLDGGPGNDELQGDVGNDTLIGGLGDDALFGQEGNDLLQGGAGTDFLDGGDGNDTYLFSAGDLNDTVNDHSGSNTLRFSSVTDAGALSLVTATTAGVGYLGFQYGAGDVVYLTSGAGSQNFTFEFAGGDSVGLRDLLMQIEGDVMKGPFGGLHNSVAYGSVDTDVILGDSRNGVTFYANSGNDYLIGGSGNESLFGHNGDDVLLAGTGDDFLDGGNGDDLLDGGAGWDTLVGGWGNDHYLLGRGGRSDLIFDNGSVDDDRDRILFDAGIGQADVALHRDGDDLLLVIDGGAVQHRVQGQFLDAAHRIEFIQFADGSAWDAPYIEAHTVAATVDTLTGGAGDDTHAVDHTGDTVVESLGGGIDTVYSSASYTLGANVEHLTLTGGYDLNATGNELDNILTGNDGNNILDGGAGTDTLRGGGGNDIYLYNEGDQIEELAGEGEDWIYLGSEGADVNFPVYRLPDNVEGIKVTGSRLNTYYIRGNEADNIMVGAAHTQNVLDGWEGADILKGGTRDDYYYVDDPGDVVIEPYLSVSEDTIISYIDYTLGDGLENLTLKEDPFAPGPFDRVGKGNALDNILIQEVSMYTRGNYTLMGMEGDDHLFTGAGGTMIGGRGNDQLEGGSNDDVYVYDLGDGYDQILDWDGDDRLVFGAGITPEDLVIEMAPGANLLASLSLPGNGRIDIKFDDYHVGLIESFEFLETGVTLSAWELGLQADIAPTVAAIPDQSTYDSSPFLYRLPDGVFSDENGGDTLTSTAALANGGALPNWLTYDSGSQTFSGTAPFGYPGPLAIQVTVTDSTGLSDSTTFNLDILPANIPPVVINPIPDRTLGQSDFYEWSLDAFFADSDAGDLLTYQAGLADGSPLPSGIYLESTDGLLTAYAWNMEPFVSFEIAVTAIDVVGHRVTDTFTLRVAAFDNVIDGTSLDDALVGGSGADRLSGYLGNDNLKGGDGDDLLEGGEGDDYLDEYWTLGDDHLDGGNGNDTLYAGKGHDELIGGAGDDTLDGQEGDDRLFGGEGIDGLWGGNGNDLLSGGAGDDNLNEYWSTGDDELDGGAGHDTLYGGAGNDRLLGGTGDDMLDSGEDDDELDGGDGDDRLYGSGGNDRLLGGRGIDELWGGAGDDRLEGGEGSDTLHGNEGRDFLYGGAGDDVLHGEAGMDTLRGGKGDDTYDGGAGIDSLADWEGGSDTYYFSRGSGIDYVTDFESAATEVDRVRIDGGVLPGEVTVRRDAYNLLLEIDGGTDRMVLRNWFSELPGQRIEQVVFDYVTVWDANALMGFARAAVATEGDDTLTGSDGAEILSGLGGSDQIFAMGGDDTVFGGAGDDWIYGEGGADALTGGAGHDGLVGGDGDDSLVGEGGSDYLLGGEGNDLLDGGSGGDYDSLAGGNGSDTYLFGRGYGWDSLFELPGTSSYGQGVDSLNFGENVSPDQLWFSRRGSHLDVAIIGTDDRMTVEDWFSYSEGSVEQFRTTDGSLLLNAQVEQLVSAMAAFSPPASGQLTLPQEMKDALDPVIAAAWQ